MHQPSVDPRGRIAAEFLIGEIVADEGEQVIDRGQHAGHPVYDRHLRAMRA